MTATTFSIVTGAEADRLMRGLPGGCFQHPAWVRAVAAARGRPHELVVVQAHRHGGAIAWLPGGLHRRAGLAVFEGMPMAGYGPWIVEVAAEAVDTEALTRQWLAQAPWPLVVLTAAPGAPPGLPAPVAWPLLPPALAQRLRPLGLLTHRLDLSGGDAELLQRARPRMRSYLRQFDRLGFEFSVANDHDALQTCHRWYLAGSQAWQTAATSRLPEGFFTALAGETFAEVWCVRFQGQEVGAALFLRGQGELQYQASGTQRIDAPLSAMEALLWAAARHHRDRGCRQLNLGASDGLDSVARFKQKFGAEPAPYLRVSYLLPRWRRCAAGAAAPAGAP